MTLKKSHTSLLVIFGAFVFAYLSSGSSSKVPTVKEDVQKETPVEPAAEENQADTKNPSAQSMRQPNFAPSYVPRVIPPGSRPRIGPTPGIIGEPIDVNSDSYNPYAELTDMMKQRREQQGDNPPPPDNTQRNLYFETLSNQLKELQGQGNATIEQGSPVEEQPGPTSAPGIPTSGNLANDNLVAPVDPAYQNEVIEESGSNVSEEDIDNEYDDAVLDEELDRLQEEGLLD